MIYPTINKKEQELEIVENETVGKSIFPTVSKPVIPAVQQPQPITPVQPVTPTTPTKPTGLDSTVPQGLDADVVLLAKAIRQHESGNRAVLPGEGAEVGGASRYQYTHGTWKEVAKKYLKDANAPMTLENENRATYLRILDWKKKGYNPAQIASMWNAGEGKPNAYAENWRGVNKWGVKYDTPAYVEKVYSTYKGLKGEYEKTNKPVEPLSDEELTRNILAKARKDAGGQLDEQQEAEIKRQIEIQKNSLKQLISQAEGLGVDKTLATRLIENGMYDKLQELMEASGAAKKMEDTTKNGFKFAVNMLTEAEQMLGKLYGQTLAMHSKDEKARQQSEQDLHDQTLKLIQQIRKNKAEGKDTTRLEKTLSDITGVATTEFEDLYDVQNLTEGQVIGASAQTVLDALGGSFTKAGVKAIESRVAGKAAQTFAPNFASGLVKQSGRQILGNVARTAGALAREGAQVGVGYGLSQGMMEDKSLGETLVQGAAGGVAGGVFGAATGALTGGISTKLFNNAVKKNLDSLYGLTRTTKGEKKVSNLVNQIAQGNIDDVDKAQKALTLIDTSDIKTYSDFKPKIKETISDLASAQDELLSADKNLYKTKDVEKTTKVGDVEVKTNYVKDALTDLKTHYEAIGDNVNKELVTQLEKKLETEGMTVKEINDIARTYNTEFGRKSFGVSGLKSGISAQRGENIRTGVKDTARSLFKDKISEKLDKEMSNLYRLDTLTKKMDERVNKAEAKIANENIIKKFSQKVGQLLGTVVDVATLGSARYALRSLLFRVGRMNPAMNSIEIQKALAKNLKVFEKLNNAKTDAEVLKALDSLLLVAKIRKIRPEDILNDIKVQSMKKLPVKNSFGKFNKPGFIKPDEFIPSKKKQVVKNIATKKAEKEVGKKSLIEEAKKYKTAQEFVNSQIKKDYRSPHQINATNSITVDKINIDDLKKAMKEKKGWLNNYDLADLKKLEKLIDNPEKEVTIYRTSPVNELNEGDWITLDKVYANDIKRQNGGKVNQFTVQVKDLRFPKDIDSLPSASMASAFQYNPRLQELTDIWNSAKQTKKAEVVKNIQSKQDISKKGVSGYHISRDEQFAKQIKKSGFSLENFGKSSGSSGDPKGIYFFPENSRIPNEWMSEATQLNTFKNVLDIQNPYQPTNIQDYLKNVVEPALGTQYKNLDELRLKATPKDSQKITDFLKSQGFDSIIDEKGILSFKEPQIVVFDPKQVNKNLEQDIKFWTDEQKNSYQYTDIAPKGSQKVKPEKESYFYHITSDKNIESIRKTGLDPKKSGGETHFNGVAAQTYDDEVLLRVKQSSIDAQESVIAPEENFFTTTGKVKPENLEIKIGNKWKSLIENKPLLSKIEKEITEPLELEVKKYKNEREFITKIEKSIVDNDKNILPIFNNLIKIKNVNEFGKGKIEHNFIPKQKSIEYWEKQIKNGERPFVYIEDFSNNKIVSDGNHRLQAYKNLGIEEIPTLDKSQLTDIWNKANKPTKPKSKTPELVLPKETTTELEKKQKEHTKAWLSRWIQGEDLQHNPPITTYKYLDKSEYKPSSPIKVYKAIEKGEEKAILSEQKKQFSSWTSSKNVAERFGKDSYSEYKIIEKTVTPDEVFVDLNKVPSNLKKEGYVFHGGSPREKEIILKPTKDLNLTKTEFDKNFKVEIKKTANKEQIVKNIQSKQIIDKSKPTTKILNELNGKPQVKRQFIEDLLKNPDIKQVEKDIITEVLKTEGDVIDSKLFAQKVQNELLPLKVSTDKARLKVDPNSDDYFANPNKYERIVLPEDLRGNVVKYNEHIYESPIKTSVGDIHFDGQTNNYFGHTRIEDMADGTTRRVIENQTDLYQRGRLGNEIESVKVESSWNSRLKDEDYLKNLKTEPEKHTYSVLENKEEIKGVIEDLKLDLEDAIYEGNKMQADIIRQRIKLVEETNRLYFSGLSKTVSKNINKRALELEKLQQYSDPTAHYRMVREEVKLAAQDGKTKLQFPTGETAMKIEGLGQNAKFMTMDGVDFELSDLKSAKVGDAIYKGDGDWIITDILEDGKFKAVPKNTTKDAIEEFNFTSKEEGLRTRFNNLSKKEQGEYLNDYLNNMSETFDISGKVDTKNPIYKFYQDTLGKYLKNRYGAKEITDAQGVKWYEMDIKPEMKDEPVLAFGTANIKTLLATGAVLGVGGLVAALVKEKKQNGITNQTEPKSTVVATATPETLSMPVFSENRIPKLDGVPLNEIKLPKETPEAINKITITHGNQNWTVEKPKELEIANRIKFITDQIKPEWTNYLLKLANFEGVYNQKQRNYNYKRGEEKGISSRTKRQDLIDAGYSESVDRGIFQINNKAFPQITDQMADNLDFSILWAISLIDAGKQDKWAADKYGKVRPAKIKVE